MGREEERGEGVGDRKSGWREKGEEGRDVVEVEKRHGVKLLWCCLE